MRIPWGAAVLSLLLLPGLVPGLPGSLVAQAPTSPGRIAPGTCPDAPGPRRSLPPRSAPADTIAAAEAAIQERCVEAILTVSGGISLGSYQSGVNWGLVEIFKRSRSVVFREAHQLPRYDLAAAAGASAGNINAFLSAIEWCKDREGFRSADNSLFWRIWVRTGFDQLVPPIEYSAVMPYDEGLFDRRYFREVHLEEMRSWMRADPTNPRADSNAARPCDIPVGATLTRLRPGRIEISPDVEAATQRFATAVNLYRGGGDQLVYTPPDTTVRAAEELGTLVYLPPMPAAVAGSSGPPRDTIESVRVFAVNQASSAFPAAFAPVTLEYIDPRIEGCEREDFQHCLRRDAFVDGGVFDNNPIDLAVGLHAARKRRDGSASSGRDAILVYINPGELRGRLLAARTRPSYVEDGKGIGALFQLLEGAIPSARQYELHSFARTLARDSAGFSRSQIRTTTRAFPIVGEHLGAFAAFLGRPFREHDFYVGVYDALHFFAVESCTLLRQEVNRLRSSAGALPSAAAGPDDPVLRTCVQSRLTALARDTSLDLGEVGRKAVQALIAWEFSAEPSASEFRVADSVAARELLTFSLLRANALLADGFDPAICGEGGVVERALCGSGFGPMIDSFYASPRVRTVVDSLARGSETGECAPANWRDSPDLCVADESFRRFVRDPTAFLAQHLALLIRQLWRVEHQLDEQARENWESLALGLEFYTHAVVGAGYVEGFDWDPSSVPSGSRAEWVFHALPNYLSFNFGSSGFELGYRPTYHLNRSWSVVGTLAPLHLIKEAEDREDKFRWVTGLTLQHKLSNPLIGGIESGVEFFGRWRGRVFTGDPVVTVPITTYLFGGRIRLGARLMWWEETDVHGDADLAFTVGPADANGLLHWALRFVDPH